MAIKLIIRDLRNVEEEYTRTFVQHKVTLGRARHCDVCLPDLSVSTSHCEVRLMGTDYCLVDLGSLNGTTMAQKRLVAHRPKKLANQDKNIELVFTYLDELIEKQENAKPRRKIGFKSHDGEKE